MAFPAAAARPLAQAVPSERIEYLKRVALLTAAGLFLSMATGMISAGAVYLLPFLQGRIISLVVILGSYGIANYVAGKVVFSGGAARWLGFAMGAVFQGIAMGYLLLAAMLMGASLFGNPFLLVMEALALTGLTAFGMVIYLWANPRELSFVKAGLSMLFLPMLILMGISFVYPIGGPIGIAVSGLFVIVSAAGLLYQVNQVLHRLRTDMHVEGAYMITMGVLILFWNILTLLMRLQRR